MSAAEMPTQPTRAVLERVTIAYHVIGQLLSGPELLDSEDAVAVANGLLTRLQDAWSDQAEFTMAIRELKQVGRTKGGLATRAKRVATKLAVLNGVCEAFLAGHSGPREFMGFHGRSGGDA